MLEEQVNNVTLEEETTNLDCDNLLEASLNDANLQTDESLSIDPLVEPSNNNTSFTSNIDNSDVQTNCLALTVRKDYNLVIVKNIFTATGRLSWKVIIATAILNLLNLMF